MAAPATGLTLVLGGGGLPGMGYLIGALQGLGEAGVSVDQPAVLLGTSAGGVVGALMRIGIAPSEIGARLLDAAHTRIPWAVNRLASYDLVRRVAGAAWVVQRAALRVPLPPVCAPSWLTGGLLEAPTDLLGVQLCDPWPDGVLWLPTVDLVSGRRRVLGLRDTDRDTIPFPLAVQAAMAVPGVFPAVRIGRELLTDGGVHSSTNLDIAARRTAGPIVCIAPLGYDRDHPPPLGRRLLRARFQHRLDTEYRDARDGRRPILVIRPGADQVRYAEPNFLRGRNMASLIDAARAQTLELIHGPTGEQFLANRAELHNPSHDVSRRATTKE